MLSTTYSDYSYSYPHSSFSFYYYCSYHYSHTSMAKRTKPRIRPEPMPATTTTTTTTTTTATATAAAIAAATTTGGGQRLGHDSHLSSLAIEARNILKAQPVLTEHYPDIEAATRERNYWAHLLSTPFADVEFLTQKLCDTDPVITPKCYEVIRALKRGLLRDIVAALDCLRAQGVFPPEQTQLDAVRWAGKMWDILDHQIIVLMLVVG